MDRLDALRVFVRVVESGSFSAVARELGIGQPAISKQIAALEQHVGAQLVRRTSRSLSVTAAGSDFYDVAVRLVGELEAAIAHAGRGESTPSGLVRASVAPVFGRLYVVPRLQELFDRHPELEVELLVSERHVNLIEENIDVAIRSGQLADSTLLARPLGSTPLLLVGSSTYLARHGEPKALRDLDRHACTLFVGGGTPRAWRFEGPAGSVLYRPKGSFRSNDADQLRAAVLGNLGLAQVPGWLLAPELASGEARAVMRDWEPPPLPITAVRPAGRRSARKVSAFIDFVAECFAREAMLGGKPAKPSRTLRTRGAVPVATECKLEENRR